MRTKSPGVGDRVGGVESGWRGRRREGSRSVTPWLARGPPKEGRASS